MNYNAEEYFKVHASLPNCMIETLLDAALVAKDISALNTGDICAGFTNEDFLRKQVEELRKVSTQLRKGPNRAAIESIIVKMESELDDQNNASEYANDELKKLDKRLAAIKSVCP